MTLSDLQFKNVGIFLSSLFHAFYSSEFKNYAACITQKDNLVGESGVLCS